MINEFIESYIRQIQFIDHKSPLPLGYQIVSGFEGQIRSRKIKTGEYLPSVRYMAHINNINPSTVARAYKVLLKKRILKAERARGYKVVARPM